MPSLRGDASVSPLPFTAQPPYSFHHSGPVLVCGSAACLFDDLDRVQKSYRNAPVIAVNGAAKLVSSIILYTKHPERFIERRWLGAQRFFFGDGASVHADVRAATRPACIEYWWTGLWGGGGSAWDARKLAASLGFGPVILCGCPLVAGPSVGSLSFASFMHREDIVEGFRRDIEADTEWHHGVKSMSGWTAEFLGSP